MEIAIRSLLGDDWPVVAAIYQQGMATGQATFETTPPSWEMWDARHCAMPRLVAYSAEGVVGWAALSPISARAVYAGVAEISIYIAEGYRSQGIGQLLLEALVRASETAGFWTLQASIFPENVASLALHAACGFRIVGRRERIGRLDGVWRDVLLLERRSSITGA